MPPFAEHFDQAEDNGNAGANEEQLLPKRWVPELAKRARDEGASAKQEDMTKRPHWRIASAPKLDVLVQSR